MHQFLLWLCGYIFFFVAALFIDNDDDDDDDVFLINDDDDEEEEEEEEEEEKEEMHLHTVFQYLSNPHFVFHPYNIGLKYTTIIINNQWQ